METKMETKIEIGERLTELMLEKGTSNKELAKVLGVALGTVGYWKKGKNNMRLPQFMAIADYFNCSLDFLAGRSDTYLDYAPQERSPFYEYLKKLMADRGISRYKINIETKIKSSHFVDWKNGSEPQIHSLIELGLF